MEQTKKRHNLYILLALALLMLVTRYHHFGSSIALPDASLAVFFAAGFYLRRIGHFVLFLLLAAGVDYASLASGTSSYCFTPGYAFLVPAYGSLWLCGLWFSRLNKTNWTSLLTLGATLLLGTILFFIFSNAGFYLLSGYFENMAVMEYAQKVGKYLLPYVLTAFAYTGLVTVAHITWKSLQRQHTKATQ